MKTRLLSVLAGTALFATMSVAEAGELMALSESQMDQVTAGVDVVIKGPTISQWVFPGGTTVRVEGGDITFFNL